MSDKKFKVSASSAKMTSIWKQICPKCGSIEELKKVMTYDAKIGKSNYFNLKSVGFNYSNKTLVIDECEKLCKNCGHVFDL